MRIDYKRLRHIMIDRDVGQKQLSEQSGVSRTAINNVANGRSCTSTTAMKIAEALNVPLEDLIENGGA